MREKSTIVVRVFTVTVTVLFLLLPCISYAAPAAATQKAAPQVQAAPSGASRMLDRNAPPSGTITITSPASGETWYPGDRKQIQWNCTGSCSLVDVTLWMSGVKIFVVGTAIGSGRTSYTVPTNAAAGSYELRVTSEYDTGVEARQPVTVITSSLHSISGTVFSGTSLGRSSNAASGVSITLQATGSASASQVRTAITDSAGKYIFAGLSDGSYTLQIGKQYIGDPAAATVKVNGADATQNFTAWINYSISGTVKTSSGAPMTSAFIKFTTGGGGTYPDGSYNIDYLYDGTKMTITPSAPGYTFNPASLTITIKGANVTGQNFVGVCQDSTKCK